MFSISVIKILFLFFPGIIATKFIEFLSGDKEKFSTHKFMISSFCLGMVSYLLTSICFNNGFISTLYLKEPNIDVPEILVATIIAFLLSCFLLWVKKSGKGHKLLRTLNITNELSHPSILKTIYNSHDKDYEILRSSWVNVRFFDSQKFIFGFVHSYGENDNGQIELLLRDVSIYKNKDDNKPIEQGALYLKTEPSKIYIEFYDDLPS